MRRAGLGARWNGRPCRVSTTDSLGAATFCYTAVDGFVRNGRRSALDRLLGATRTHRGWGDAYAHALVATGRADLAVEPIMNIWDNAPLLPILAEAGGRFTDWAGASRIDGGDAVSTNGVLHDAVLSLCCRARLADPAELDIRQESLQMDEQQPTSFGRYKVKGVIGKGAMGVIYLAEDPVIGRQLAIKVIQLNPGISGAGDREPADPLRARVPLGRARSPIPTS